jgi:hypothetical protein
MRKVGARSLLSHLWDDDCGALISVEWVVVATILVLGIIPGLVAIRAGVLSELTEWANSVLSLDQSYSFSGQELTCNEPDSSGRRWYADRATGERFLLRTDDPRVAAGRVEALGVRARTAGSAATDRPDHLTVVSTRPRSGIIRTTPCD